MKTTEQSDEYDETSDESDKSLAIKRCYNGGDESDKSLAIHARTCFLFLVAIASVTVTVILACKLLAFTTTQPWTYPQPMSTSQFLSPFFFIGAFLLSHHT